MPKGGVRQGAGRPKDIAKTAASLDRIRDKMQAEFYEAAFLLSNSNVELTRLAIDHARGGDKNMLRFLLEHFWKMVGALPQEDDSKYTDIRARILAVVDTYASEQRPEAVGSRRERDAVRVEAPPDGSHELAVFRPVEDTPRDGGRAGG